MQEVDLAEVLDHLLFDRALEGEVELPLAGGEVSRLIRLSPPWDSREATSVESKASAKRS